MTMPTQQASQIPMGPPNFVTFLNIIPNPTPTGFSVTFDTDQPCQVQMAWWPTLFPNTGPGVSGGPSDSSPVTHHVLAVNIGAGVSGQSYQFQLVQAAADASGLIFRPYQGSVQIRGLYNPATPAIPVRWNMFGDGTAPAHGGGTGPLLNGPGSGNWSTYTWPQYNPKRTTYPTP